MELANVKRKDSVVHDKSFRFAVRIVKLAVFLQE